MPLERHEQDRLIQENLVLVGYRVSETIRRVPTHVQRDELAAAGSLALVQAARAFDPDRGVPFGHYAAVRIRGAILDELRGMDWAPRGARHRARQLNELTDQLTASLGRAPSTQELADAIGVDVSTVRATRGDADRRIVSLDPEETPAAASLTDGRLTPEDRLLVDERLHYLSAAVAVLPEKHRVVVEGVFFKDRTVVEIAAQLGVTQSRISQLRTQALQMLKDAMNTSLEPELAPPPSPKPGLAEKRRHAYCTAVAERAGAARDRFVRTGAPRLAPTA